MIAVSTALPPMSRPTARRLSARAISYCWLFMLIAVCACGPVRFVSAYDEILDRGVSDLHTKVAAFTIRMTALSGKPEGMYEPNTAFYEESAATISTLRLRAGLDEKNDLTVKMLDDLRTNVEHLRQLHQLGKDRGLSKALADPAMQALEVNFESILKLEIAKRRGGQTPN